MPDPDTLSICAFCPAPCRAALGAAHEQVPETRLPSALALLARAALMGQIALTHELFERLSDLGAVRLCQSACSYHLDVASALEAARIRLEGEADGC